jgi:hypothetical protein
MKYLYTITIALFTMTNVLAQGYEELLELVVDEKYERCLYKAIKYTENDKTKKDPEPYAYMSMAFFRISQSDDPDLRDKYPKAAKEAIKYLVKFVKKDKEGEFIGEFQDFISEVRVATVSEAEQHSDEDKYTKSKGLYKYLTDIDENDPGAWLMRGHSEWMMKSKKDAKLSWEQAKKVLDQNGIRNLRSEQVDLLKMAVIRNSEMLYEIGEREDARNWLRATESFFKEDKEFSIVYGSIVG